MAAVDPTLSVIIVPVHKLEVYSCFVVGANKIRVELLFL